MSWERQAHGLQNFRRLPLRAEQGGVKPQVFPPAQAGIEPRLLNERPHPAAGHQVPDGFPKLRASPRVGRAWAA